MKASTQYGAREILFLCFAAVSLGAVVGMVLRVSASLGFWDFNVFYSSAAAALHGSNFYTTYGAENLPYWYFPWLAWFFTPLALLPYPIAKILYLGLTLISAAAVVWVLSMHFNPRTSLALQLFILSMSLLMTMLLFIAGQMDFILAGVITATMLLLRGNRPIAAGLLFPILLFKPHVLGVFLPFLFLRGGRRYRITVLTSLVVLSIAAFLAIPNWPGEMIRMLRTYGGRADNYWNFITLPQLLGSQENWSGTAHLPVSLGLFVIGLLIAWRFRRLPLVPFLALTLAASMLCAPRAYTYNLPILMPPMIWISANRPLWGTLLWLGAGIAALASNWSTGAYLIVTVVFILAILEARRTEPGSETAAEPA
jgi:hypothetical protein